MFSNSIRKKEEADHSNDIMHQFNIINMAHILKNSLSKKTKNKKTVLLKMQLPL